MAPGGGRRRDDDAYRRGIAARQAEADAFGWERTVADTLRSRRISTPEGHPDLILVNAVRDRVLSVDEAELIGGTRVEGESPVVASQRLGLSYPAGRQRRSRAERRLGRYLGHRTLVAPPATADTGGTAA